jgi:hypothetical protein
MRWMVMPDASNTRTAISQPRAYAYPAGVRVSSTGFFGGFCFIAPKHKELVKYEYLSEVLDVLIAAAE